MVDRDVSESVQNCIALYVSPVEKIFEHKKRKRVSIFLFKKKNRIRSSK